MEVKEKEEEKRTKKEKVPVPKGLLKGLERPNSVEFQQVEEEEGYGRFVAEPFEKGFGTTIGNSLRRVLMSCIEGAAIVAIRVEGISHEFSTIPGVTEDLTRVILNLKQVCIRYAKSGICNIEVEKKGAGVFLASDLALDPNIEIMNPNLLIAHLNEDADFTMTLQIERGRGYLPSEVTKKYIEEIGTIPIDALFSPIKKVNFEVTETRVGQRTDYDRLTLEVWTDMSIAPKDAVAYAAKILKEHLSIFIDFEEEEYEEDDEYDETDEKLREYLNISLEQLEISVRSMAVMKSLDMKIVRDLVSRYEDDLRKSKHYSDKVLLELKSQITEMGLSFGMRELARN